MTGCFMWPWGNGHMAVLCQTHRSTDSVTVIVYNENSPSQLSKSQEPVRDCSDCVDDRTLVQEAHTEAELRHMERC